jgi:hypothetical protein
MAKCLAAKASCEAANVCLQFHGGYGFAHEYDIERKLRKTRLYQAVELARGASFGLLGFDFGRVRSLRAALRPQLTTELKCARRCRRRSGRSPDASAPNRWAG